MRKNHLLWSMALLFAVLLPLTSCVITPSHQCQFSSEWKTDADSHWHICTVCGKVGEKSNHRWDLGVETTPATETSTGVKTYTCLDCGYKTQSEIPKTHTTHIYDQKVVTDAYFATRATCDQGSKYYYSCTCGEKGFDLFTVGEGTGHTYSKEWSYDETAHWHVATCEHDDQVSGFSAHQWNSGVITKQPSETEEGEKTFTCIICKTTKTETISVCSYTEKVTSDKYLAKAADCLNPAKYYYSCVCGEKGSETFSYGDPLGHSFTKYVSNNDATCTADGTKIAKCDRCDVTDTKPDAGSMLNHSYTIQTVSETYLASAANCNDAAKYYYSCVCGKKGIETFDVGSALGHSFTMYVSNDDATCTADGTKTAKCDRCDTTDTKPDAGSMLNHSYTEQTVLETYFASAADCTNAAKYYYSCVCGIKGDTTFDVGSALGHSFTNYVSNDDATCGTDGTKTAKCDRCGETKTISDPGTKLPHTYSAIWSSDDTYHWHNATCMHTDLSQDKNPHNWEDTGTVITVATETVDGVKEQKCSVCGKTRNVNTGKLDHVHTYAESWTYDEIYHWHAATCGHTNLTDGKAAHQWNTGETTRESTVYEEGVKVYTCQICECTKEEAIPMKPSYKVSFYDGETLLNTQNVEPGKDATPPLVQCEEGFRFKQWDKPYTNVSGNIDVFAEFVEFYLVEIVDSVNGNVVYAGEIDKGGYLKATDIEIPDIQGYVFDGYYLNGSKLSSNFTRVVQSNMQIEARYIEQFTVTFTDYDGSVLATQKVSKGANASYPTHPSRDGYTFKTGSAGWNKTNLNIQEDTIITAIYDINYYTVNFYTPDHILLDSQSVAYKHFAVVPDKYSDSFFTWNKTISGYDKQTLYTDPEWDKEPGEITEDTDYTLIYKTKVDDLVLIMDDVTISSKEIKQDNKKANVVLSVYSQTETVCGLNLVVDYHTYDANGNQVNYIYFDDTFVNNDTKVNYKNIVKYGEYSKNYSEIVDTNKKSIQYVWSTDGNGLSLQYGNNDIITIAFSLSPNIPEGEYKIQITAESYYIDGNLTKTTPVIVSGKIIVTE